MNRYVQENSLVGKFAEPDIAKYIELIKQSPLCDFWRMWFLNYQIAARSRSKNIYFNSLAKELFREALGEVISAATAFAYVGITEDLGTFSVAKIQLSKTLAAAFNTFFTEHAPEGYTNSLLENILVLLG